MNKVNKIERLNFSFALLCIAISILAWLGEFAGMYSVCPYCQVERTAIGLLGIFMICRFNHYLRVPAMVAIAFIGMHVAVAQLFMHFHDTSYSIGKTPLVIAVIGALAIQISLIINTELSRLKQDGVKTI